MLKKILLVSLAVLIAACSHKSTQPVNDKAADVVLLKEVISARSDKDKARDQYRHPLETISFFRISPSDTVVELLPSGGWYTRVLAPYLAEDGALYGLNYSDVVWEQFRARFGDEQIEARKRSMETWRDRVVEFGGNDRGIGVKVGENNSAIHGTADHVLMSRGIHHVFRFENSLSTFTATLEEAKALLKSGGYVGVVQHRAPEESADEWAVGANGYVKQSAVIAAFENAGFVLVERSEINANPLDKPKESDNVWRLPPTQVGHKNEESKLRAAAIGESDRMTLLFQKP